MKHIQEKKTCSIGKTSLKHLTAPEHMFLTPSNTLKSLNILYSAICGDAWDLLEDSDFYDFLGFLEGLLARKSPHNRIKLVYKHFTNKCITLQSV